MTCKSYLVELWAKNHAWVWCILAAQLCIGRVTALDLSQHTQPEVPLLFLQNAGQIVDPSGAAVLDVLFTLRDKGALLCFRKNGISVQYTQIVSDSGLVQSDFRVGTTEKIQIARHRFDMELVGASMDAKITTEAPNEYYEQYYLPHCGDGVRASSFGRVVVHDVYPNIDWVLYVVENRLKYDFVVREGGDYRRIRMQYSGMDGIEVDTTGSLSIRTRLGTYTDSRPILAPLGESSIRYTLDGNDVVSFEMTGSVPGGAFTIDPSVTWAGYYGDSGTDYGTGTAADAFGNIYLAGSTDSPGNLLGYLGFIMEYQQGASDWFLVKWGPNGGPRLWSTYYGSTGQDGSNGLANGGYDGDIAIANISNAIYFSGTTSSTAGAPFSTLNTVSGACSGYQAFLIRFDFSGNRVWSRYYGGSTPCSMTTFTAATDVAVDDGGAVYLTGATQHTNLLQAGVQLTSYQGGITDAFVAKIGATGVVVWDRYLGLAGQVANGEDVALAIAVDYLRDPIIVGYTRSSQGFGVNAFQNVLKGSQDGFIVKLNTNTGATRWSTYYGGLGSAGDDIRDVAVDKFGQVYAVGLTSSTQDIASCGAQQPTPGGTYSAFLVKFSPFGQRHWGTYCSGAVGFGVCVSPDGSVFVTGSTSQSGVFDNGLLGYNGLSFTALNGTQDVYVAQFNNHGRKLWSSYWGGSAGESGLGLAFDAVSNQVLIVGTTVSQGLQTANQWQYSAVLDAFIMKVSGVNTNAGGQISIALRALLGGAVPINASCIMAGSLNVPLPQPFSLLGFSHFGSESTTPAVLAVAGNARIVDWVLIELRDGTSPCKVISTRAALLQAGGAVVDLDGVSAVPLTVPSSGNYCVVLRHRNHLGVMTANAYSFVIGGGPVSIDFTSPGTAVYTTGPAPRMTLSCGRLALWPGNAKILDQQPGKISMASDAAQILSKLGGNSLLVLNGYFTEDVNLNNVLRYSGASNDKDFILSVPLSGNNSASVTEQVPY